VINVCLICSPLLIVKVSIVITVFFSFLCVSTTLVNKDDHIASDTEQSKNVMRSCTDSSGMEEGKRANAYRLGHCDY